MNIKFVEYLILRIWNSLKTVRNYIILDLFNVRFFSTSGEKNLTMVTWTIRQYYSSDWKIQFCLSGINILLQDSSLLMGAAPEPFKVASFKL